MYSEQDRGLVVAVTVFFVIKSAVSQMSETIKKNNHPVLDSLETETTAEGICAMSSTERLANQR